MKKILIVVYYWPPAGGAAVQRWLKFVKYLPEFGWNPTIITTKNGDYPVSDQSLKKDIPEKVRVIKTKTFSFNKLFQKIFKQDTPYASLQISPRDSFLKKILLWIRINLVVPDARVLWNFFAYPAAKKELKLRKYDVIITSGPPHSTHLIGLKIKKKIKIKWIADFRDPWTSIDYLTGLKRFFLASRFDSYWEQKVISKADKLLTINRSISLDLKQSQKTVIISNGFDDDDFADIPDAKSDLFNINYFGNITQERTPKIVLNAVNELFPEHKKIRINFWGNISDSERHNIQRLDFFHIVDFHCYTPHSEILKYLFSSSLLLLLINNVRGNEGILTGKIFEYLAARKPILGIGPISGEAAAILQKTNSGKMFDYQDKKGVAKFISDVYQQKIKFDFDNIQQYSRKELTKKLSIVL